jgi:ribonuclease BN (tRNA processing enzyme)
MRLTTVGTGTAAPHPSRVQAGHLVEAGDVRLLLDCGSGVAHRLASLGLDWGGITHVALTHFHADHVADLVTLLVAWRYGQLPPRTAPVTLIGPVGTRALFDRLIAAFDVSVGTYGYAVTVVEVASGDTVVIGEGVTLAATGGVGASGHGVVWGGAPPPPATGVPHTAESVAYCVAHAGRRLVFGGDTAYAPELADWAAGCDVLLLECSLPAALAVPTHLTPEQAGALAARAHPGHLVLTHFHPPVETVDIAALVRASYHGPLTLAFDGWSTALT